MVVGLIGLQYLVESFEKERPEVMERPKISNTFSDVSGIVMVGFNSG